ncbi:MAG: hypothetical protein RR320_01525 [Oscillospiraceae bacterium]
MLVSKTVQIEFADPRMRASDALEDLRRGAEAAALNLFSRHDVRLQIPRILEDNRVVVEIKLPEELVETFAVGNHLRGIASYLLKSCNGRYEPYVSGNRLLNYYEVAAPKIQADSLPMTDRLEAVSAFARLLERSDAEAMEQIGRIRMILKEARSE